MIGSWKGLKIKNLKREWEICWGVLVEVLFGVWLFREVLFVEIVSRGLMGLEIVIMKRGRGFYLGVYLEVEVEVLLGGFFFEKIVIWVDWVEVILILEIFICVKVGMGSIRIVIRDRKGLKIVIMERVSEFNLGVYLEVWVENLYKGIMI